MKAVRGNHNLVPKEFTCLPQISQSRFEDYSAGLVLSGRMLVITLALGDHDLIHRNEHSR